VIHVMTLVLNAKIPGPASVKYILLVLANFADIEGRNVYPSVPTVQAMSGHGEATVRRAIRQLESSGLLVLVNEARQHSARRYRLDLDALRRLPQVNGRQVARAVKASPLDPIEGNHGERPEDHQGDHGDRQGNHGEPQGGHHEPLSGNEPSRTGRDAAPSPNVRSSRRELGSRRRDTSHPVMPFTDRGRRSAEAAKLWLEGGRVSSEGLNP
jgi:hypothetical protein